MNGKAINKERISKRVKLSSVIVPERIRSETGSVRDLCSSMSKYGLLQPIIIDKNYKLIAGYRRFTAAYELGWEQIDAIVVPTRSKRENLTLEVHENEIRRNFTQKEMLIARKMLRKHSPWAFVLVPLFLLYDTVVKFSCFLKDKFFGLFKK